MGCMGKALGRPLQTTSSLAHFFPFSPAYLLARVSGPLSQAAVKGAISLVDCLLLLPSPLFTGVLFLLPHSSGLTGDPLFQTPRGASVGIMSKPQSTNGSESEFEFIETPKAPTPSFEKFEECGVRTTSVRLPILRPQLCLPVSWHTPSRHICPRAVYIISNGLLHSIPPSRTPPCPPTPPVTTASP